MTTVLRIEHPVDNFERGHQAFNGDPVGRERGGVRRCRIVHASDDEDYVLIDLESSPPKAAATLMSSLRAIWKRVEVIRYLRARVALPVEERALVKHPTPA